MKTLPTPPLSARGSYKVYATLLMSPGLFREFEKYRKRETLSRSQLCLLAVRAYLVAETGKGRRK